MTCSTEAPRIPRNHLLAALPPEIYAELRPRLDVVELSLRQVVLEANQLIDLVYFPESGWLSMLAYLDDGDVSEVALIGQEGMVGLPVVLGGDSDILEAMVQGSGTALRMSAAALQEAMERFPILTSLLLRHALVHQRQVARTAVCNGQHSDNQRLARWLLMAHDRAGGDEFLMSDDFLAMMLGVHRGKAMACVSALQTAGLIHYEEDRLRIMHRLSLEHTACECYSLERRDQDRILGRWADAINNNQR